MVRARRLVLSLAVLAGLGAGLLAPAALARLSAPQRFFRSMLLEDRDVERDVKTRLRKGGFVDRGIRFADLTAEGRSDAVVLVHSGGSAGRIALYVFSAGRGERLRLVYRNERLYRGSARVPRTSGRPSLFYKVPVYDRGDELCCPGAYLETELRWSSTRRRFVLAGRRRIERPRPAGTMAAP